MIEIRKMHVVSETVQRTTYWMVKENEQEVSVNGQLWKFTIIILLGTFRTQLHLNLKENQLRNPF